MRPFFVSSLLIAAFAVTMPLAASAKTAASWMSPAALQTGRPLLYASGIAEVNVYAAFGDDTLPVGQLGAFSGINTPDGLATDLDGNVWVAQPGGSNGATNEVLAFPRGRLKPTFVIHQPFGVEPVFVTVDKHGTVYVADFEYYGMYYVNEFPKGRFKPFVTFGPFFDIGGLTVDGNDNLYLDYTVVKGTTVTGRISKFAPGQTQGVDLGITVPGFPGGITLTPSGDLLVVNNTLRDVATYAPGQTSPSHTIVVPALGPYPIAIGPNGANIFVGAGGGFCCGPSALFEMDYGSGHVVKDITAGFPSSYPPNGLAVSPRYPFFP
jgi:hypothetical protein